MVDAGLGVDEVAVVDRDVDLDGVGQRRDATCLGVADLERSTAQLANQLRLLDAALLGGDDEHTGALGHLDGQAEVSAGVIQHDFALLDGERRRQLVALVGAPAEDGDDGEHDGEAGEEDDAKRVHAALTINDLGAQVVVGGRTGEFSVADVSGTHVMLPLSRVCWRRSKSGALLIQSPVGGNGGPKQRPKRIYVLHHCRQIVKLRLLTKSTYIWYVIPN